MKSIFNIFLLLFFALISVTGFTQELEDDAEDELESLLFMDVPVVVSASLKPQKSNETPVVVSVVGEEEINMSGATNIPELLQRISGVSVSHLTSSGGQINIRDFADPIDSRNVLVLIDGRPVYTDFSGQILWEGWPIILEDIKRIEILKGPASSLYGANAYSGIINIITKTAKEAEGTRVTLRIGELNTKMFSLLHSKTFESFEYKISLGADKINDWKDDSETSKEMKRLNCHINYKLDEKENLLFEGGISNGEAESITGSTTGITPLDGSFMKFLKWQYNNNNWKTTFFWQREDFEFEFERIRDIYITYNYLLGTPIGQSSFFILQDIYQLDIQNSFEWQNHEIVWGGAIRDSEAESDVLSQDVDFSLKSIFIDDQIKLSNEIIFSIGGRFDDHSIIGSTWSGRAGLLYKTPDDKNIFRLSASNAFKLPSLADLYLDLQVLTEGNKGNPDIEPQEIFAYEFSYQTFFSERSRMNFNLYYNDLKNLIWFLTGTSSTNEVEGRIYGGEIEFAWVLGENLNLKANYTYINKEIEINISDNPQKIEYDPSHKIFGTVSYKIKNIIMNMSVTHVFPEIDEYHHPEEFTQVDVNMIYKLSNWEISLGALNITDDNYYNYPYDESRIGRKAIAKITGTF